MGPLLPVGRIKRYISVISAYLLPAVVIWATFGLIVNALPIRSGALAIVAAYCFLYGSAEFIGKTLRSPGRRWQVPQNLVIDTSWRRRLLVWGAILGPGFMTRNPYAGFGASVLVVATAGGITRGVIMAGATGAAHSTARALAMLRDAKRPTAGYLESAIRAAQWKRRDGLALLTLAAMAAVILARTA